MKRHRVWVVRYSQPGDPDHPRPPFTPVTVCSTCGKRVHNIGRMRDGSPWVHGRMKP